MNRSATCRAESRSRPDVSRGSNGAASGSHGSTPSAGLKTPLPPAGGAGGGPARSRPPGPRLAPPASGRGNSSPPSPPLLPRQQLAELRVREVHRHVVAVRPGLADLLLRQQPVGPDRVLGVELLGRLQVAGGVRPAFLVVALPLHLVVEPLDLPR